MSTKIVEPAPQNNGGWLKKLLMWDWHTCCLDDYPGWEIEKVEHGRGHPAFCKLEHVRGKGDVESNILCNAWDDVAEVRFYQRDWTQDGIPFVHEGEKYWSGWWFQTVAERDRFMVWVQNREQTKAD